ncbi:MAG TPA: ABC transporter substrate-binding protein [Thermodesulfobacteriota bacterium]|nr:ABC transporter substrate-binding protein [Thermodesulfobacteriota bacterium]
MKRSFSSLIILLFLSIFIDSGYSQPSLKVGALVPFTGRWGDSGRECAKGILDAGKWINHKGAVFGRKLEILLIEDTAQIAETMAAYRKLNEADHILLLYIYSTETALALLPHIHFNRIPTLVSSLPSDLANPSKSPFVFTVTPTILDLAKIALNFVSDTSGIKTRKPKMVFVGSLAHLDRHFLEEAKNYAKGLGVEVGPEVSISDFFSSGNSASSPLSAMASYEPDFAYLSLTSRESLLVLQEAKRIGLKTKWIGNRKAFDEGLAPFEGVFGVQPVAPYGEDVPGMAAIKEAHQRSHPFDFHSLAYVEGWATSQVIAETLGRSLPEQGPSREKVKGSLESFKGFVLGGIVPPITITSSDHRPSVESRILIVKEGKLSRHTSFISVGR